MSILICFFILSLSALTASIVACIALTIASASFAAALAASAALATAGSGAATAAATGAATAAGGGLVATFSTAGGGAFFWFGFLIDTAGGFFFIDTGGGFFATSALAGAGAFVGCAPRQDPAGQAVAEGGGSVIRSDGSTRVQGGEAGHGGRDPEGLGGEGGEEDLVNRILGSRKLRG